MLSQVNVNTVCALEQPAVSINSMVYETLGPAGSRITGAVYLFINYTVLVAYLLQGSTLAFELLPLAGTPPAAVATPAFTLGLGGALLVASQEQAEVANTALVFGVVLSFVALLAFGAPQVDVSLLRHADGPAVVGALFVCRGRRAPEPFKIISHLHSHFTARVRCGHVD